MILLLTIIIAVIAIAAMLYIYNGMMIVQKEYLQSLRKELEEAKDTLNFILPELKRGLASTCVIDRKNMDMTFDEGCAKKMGFPHSHWVVPEFREICNPDSHDVFEKWIGQYTLLTDPVNRRLRFHLTFDGGKTYHWYELVYVLKEETKEDAVFPSIFSNIDDVIAIESSIDQARNILYQTELKQTLLASINHDLRTPINAIAGFASLLVTQYDELSEEDRNTFAEVVESNCDILLQLLSDFSDTNCNDFDKIKFKPRNKSVSELINIIYQTNKVICPSHLTFKLDTPDSQDDKIINVDAKRVEQVINNFISNSFKFTQAGFVTVGWKNIDETGEVELFVEDSGIGIKEQDIDKLFDQFYKVQEHARGTGLGLNICKKIVEKQQGVIGVESVYGRGSKFYCRFKTV